jgi:phosphate transport system substrate-binding protein
VVHVIMENRWRTAYRKEKGIEVDYDSTGSTRGIREMIAGTYAIGFTHSPITEAQRKEARGKGGEVLQVPVVLCAVVPIYNVKELKDAKPLNFTGKVLADIYLGKIKKWNDPALKELNPDLARELPDKEIIVVHREDSSGTTFIFADFLAGASEAWKEKVGTAANEITWPTGVGKARNSGVTAHVRATDGTIGYVDLLWAFAGEKDEKVQHGAVRNKDDTSFIHAEAKYMTAAVQGLLTHIPDDLTFELTNKPGDDSYPICGVIWAICYQNQPAANQKKVTEFLDWIMHDGQKWATDMSYAPLPEELVKRVEKKLESIKVVP